MGMFSLLLLIGITAGGVGLDFSSARNVIFLELPKTASDLLQAEDRAHRRGQKNAVNIYIFEVATPRPTNYCNLNLNLINQKLQSEIARKMTFRADEKSRPTPPAVIPIIATLT